MDHSPAKFVLLLMAATTTWTCSFFLITNALLVPERTWRREILGHPHEVHGTGGSCIRRERDALLAFKQGINDTVGYLNSWQKESQNCCEWTGIICDDTTGHVIQLDLDHEQLVGEISVSLLSLEHLEFLSLEGTSLRGPDGRIPEFLGSLKNLRSLDLSHMVFSGVVPPQLGNLSKLESLYLANISFLETQNQLTDISWLARLHLLSTLDMSNTNLSFIMDWPLVVNMIPSLEELSLSGCSLSSASGSLAHFNLTRLGSLDLSKNYFGHSIASCWFWNATNIKSLDFSDTSMYGPFPNVLENMTSLQILSFDNTIGIGNRATLTADLTNLCDLEILSLGGSLSSGNITKFLEKLPHCSSNMLAYITLNNNNMVGVLPERLGHLAGIKWLEFSNNKIDGPIPPGIASCAYLMSLYLSNNSLSGHVPSTINMLTNLVELDLSNNNLDGVITEEHVVTLSKLEDLDLSHNSLSGPLPLEFETQGLSEVTLSFNNFSGHVPRTICLFTNLLILDLSNNFLEGELPQCSQLAGLAFLLLSNNSFSGEFPPSLRNYHSVAFLDLSWNNFYGTLPSWIGELVGLRFLQLSHNMFHGDIPLTITNLNQLRLLNLAGNNISGVIPQTLSNLTAMSQTNMSVDYFFEWYEIYVGKFSEVLPVVMKRQALKYGVLYFEVVGIDLSLNYLSGGIPEEITSLIGLMYLNLSWNHLSGEVPAKIGAMKLIESLDLSRNTLYGEIPTSMSDWTYLSCLDLSYTNLTGRIPSGSQLDTLYAENPFIYNGNIALCGHPLERNCSGDDAPKHMNQEEREKVYPAVLFFYYGLGSGCTAGLWVVFCTLLFKKSWRVAYFILFDKLYDNAYVFVAVTWGKMKGNATISKVAF